MEIVNGFITRTNPLTTERQALAEKFNDVAEIFYEEFPAELARLAVVVTDFDTLPYVSPQVAKEVTKNPAQLKPVLTEISQVLSHRKAVGVTQHGCYIAGTPVSLVALHDMGNLFNTYSDPAIRQMVALYYLIHELGHLVLKNGSGTIKGVSQHLAESACDALAILLHIQLFGKDTYITRNYAIDGAQQIVLNRDAAHYTPNTVQRVMEVAEEKGEKFFRLSLREMIALAEEIAGDYALDDTSLQKIHEAYELVGHIFAQTQESGINTDKQNAIASLAILLVMKQNRGNANIFNAGRDALELPALKAVLDKAQPGWRDAFAFTNEYEPAVRYRNTRAALQARM